MIVDELADKKVDGKFAEGEQPKETQECEGDGTVWVVVQVLAHAFPQVDVELVLGVVSVSSTKVFLLVFRGKRVVKVGRPAPPIFTSRFSGMVMGWVGVLFYFSGDVKLLVELIESKRLFEGIIDLPSRQISCFYQAPKYLIACNLPDQERL